MNISVHFFIFLPNDVFSKLNFYLMKIESFAGQGVEHTINPSTREAEEGKCVGSRQVPGQLGLHREILSQANRQTNKQMEEN